LWRSLVGVREHEPLDHPSIQPLSNQAQQHAVTYPLAKDLPEVGMPDGVEEFPDVDLDEPPSFHPPRRLLDRFHRLVRGTTGPKAIRELVELLLVDLPDHHRHCTLQDLVLEGWNSDRPGFRPIALRDVDPPHSRCAIATGFGAVQERLEVGLQLLRVLLRTLSVDGLRPVLPGAAVGLA
jgi:hypothetical protein